jgi:hypothetical protein
MVAEQADAIQEFESLKNPDGVGSFVEEIAQ